MQLAPESIIYPQGGKKEQLEKQDGKCANCEKEITEKEARSHHYPTRHADGGKETVVVCEPCHKEKHKK